MSGRKKELDPPPPPPKERWKLVLALVFSATALSMEKWGERVGGLVFLAQLAVFVAVLGWLKMRHSP